MFAEERQRRITELATAHGRVAVSDLAERFHVTSETVRRDLAVLESDGALRRVHGGAVPVDNTSTVERSLEERQTEHQEEKLRIAEAALKLIPASRTGSVLLDAGTTTEQLADLLVHWQPATPGAELLAITNALPIASKLSNGSAVQLQVLGGKVRGLTSAAVGPSTVEQLESLRPDIAFVGANGVHPRFGLSTPDSEEAAVKAAIVRSARRVVALVDSSKLGEEALVRFAGLRDIDTLITNAEPPSDLAAALREAEVEVVIA